MRPFMWHNAALKSCLNNFEWRKKEKGKQRTIREGKKKNVEGH